ncbi:MAG: hypothetical protein A2499_04975 [Stygiobacter sp. RIFOXYC12_FULL_38_8]|nr:MAG: hypothetical protein A2299_16345 [Stygiobacter sp. RIFOXYB2_FULL_37_11]OGV13478.1 MAG: hypothetical protein A2237_17040 [Stygiobacter sp. RIFOXYA2_FULL_38_8]OGV14769.1 MAG: hypothetical protein A2440_09725 [Stygiobacter sp. RIFOXYC2_FULL_38_25]OGV22304.1 MAG: hypothetical protein A2499_04975 [Stygiobacter sp. RIFOXYC12_FULL_38_8]OGV79262.1 MAG: hypothetical protein A2X65_02095 [Stygiobacter sp. GWF2_38_21]
MNEFVSMIERIKEDARTLLQNDSLKLKRAIIREIDYLWHAYSKQYDFGNIEKFADYIFNFLKIPAVNRNEILKDLREAQLQIGTVWDEYFKASVGEKYKAIDYEKILAVHSVDFPAIQKNTRDLVVKTFRESVRKNYSFETIRAELQKGNVGTHEAFTLSSTGMAQYANATMFEYARQAGLNKFLYNRIGSLTENSRPFCVVHHKKIFTYEQILTLDNGQGLSVLTSCGGYLCKDFWSVIVD